MKKLTQNLVLISVTIFTIIMLFNGCENTTTKVKEVDNKRSDYLQQFGLTVDDNIFLNLIIQDSTNNIYSDIRYFMDNLNLSYNSSDTPLGIAFLYDDIIDTVNFSHLKAVIYYYTENNENKAKVWLENGGNLQLDQNYSKINYFVATEDIYRIGIAENLGTNQVLLMIDQTVLPIEPYYSEFQTAIDKKYDAFPHDPGGDEKKKERLCSRNPDCSLDDYSGTCYFHEGQQNTSAKCSSLSCYNLEASSILSTNNTPLDTNVIPKIYNIRDNVLLNDNKYEYLIDDYYYLSTVIAQNITLSIALDIKDLSNTNFFDIFKNYNNNYYADSVLINSVSKPLILSICNKSKNLTTDTRATNILNNTINLANTYDNKTISYIKNN